MSVLPISRRYSSVDDRDITITVTDADGVVWTCHRDGGRIHGRSGERSVSVPVSSMTAFKPQTAAERALRGCDLMV